MAQAKGWNGRGIRGRGLPGYQWPTPKGQGKGKGCCLLIPSHELGNESRDSPSKRRSTGSFPVLGAGPQLIFQPPPFHFQQTLLSNLLREVLIEVALNRTGISGGSKP